MKKIIIPISALFITGTIHAQLTQGENYIKTKTYLDYGTGGQDSKISEIVQYFDGLGRPKQTVEVKASLLGKDVVIPIEYDEFGRQLQNYLPIPQAGTLNRVFTTYPLSNEVDTAYCSKEISPDTPSLNRILVKNDWIDKSVKFEYHVNVSQENLVESNQLI